MLRVSDDGQASMVLSYTGRGTICCPGSALLCLRRCTGPSMLCTCWARTRLSRRVAAPSVTWPQATPAKVTGSSPRLPAHAVLPLLGPRRCAEQAQALVPCLACAAVGHSGLLCWALGRVLPWQLPRACRRSGVRAGSSQRESVTCRHDGRDAGWNDHP